MSGEAFFYHAEDDEFIRAAGYDPQTIPEFEDLKDFAKATELNLSQDDIDALWSRGFLMRQRRRGLEERFKLFGVDVVVDLRSSDEEARSLILSDGRVLREMRNVEEERALEDPDDGGGLFHFAYTKVRLLTGPFHNALWCPDCEKSIDLKTDLPVYDGLECPHCGRANTKLISVDDCRG